MFCYILVTPSEKEAGNKLVFTVGEKPQTFEEGFNMKKKFTIATLVLGLSVAAGSVYAASNSDMWAPATSSEPVNLEEMAKEKGITLDELIAQLEEEGKLIEAVETTESIPAESSNK